MATTTRNRTRFALLSLACMLVSGATLGCRSQATKPDPAIKTSATPTAPGCRSAKTDGPTAPDPERVVTGRIVHGGVLECFAEGLSDEDGKLVHCETSAVHVAPAFALIASDKVVPSGDGSSAFAIDLDDEGRPTGAPRFLRGPVLSHARKLEDFAPLGGGRVLLTTGFDRIDLDSTKWDAFNQLLLLDVDTPDADARVLAASERDGEVSSRLLRDRIRAALATPEQPSGPRYFKTEGLVVLPNGRLVFGVRESGNRYDDFRYRVALVEIQIHIDGDEVTFGDAANVLYDFDASAHPGLGHTVGLSSLTWDESNQTLVLLTSYEDEDSDEGLGGFLWALPLADLDCGAPPSLIVDDTGAPLHFAHKAEGVASIRSGRFLVVHDDDRVLGRELVEDERTQFRREPHQTSWNVVDIDFVQPPPVM